MGRVFEKLVRDRIPEIIEAKGEIPLVEVLDSEAYMRCLDAKMQEELEEYLEEGSMEEMADLLEVIRAAIAARGHTWDEVEALRAAKAERNGAFEKKLFLRDVKKQSRETAPGGLECSRGILQDSGCTNDENQP